MPLTLPTATRSRTITTVVAVCALGALGSCGVDQKIGWNDLACEKAMNEAESVDAFDWFKDPTGGPKRLGKWSNDEGLAFAETLQMKGAKRVVTVGVSRRKGADEHERARGLVVELPADPSARLSLFKLYAEQVRAQGFAPQADAGQMFLYLPWKP